MSLWLDVVVLCHTFRFLAVENISGASGISTVNPAEWRAIHDGIGKSGHRCACANDGKEESSGEEESFHGFTLAERKRFAVHLQKLF